MADIKDFVAEVDKTNEFETSLTIFPTLVIKLGKCLDRSDLLHKVFVADCDTSKTTQKWEMNNLMAV